MVHEQKVERGVRQHEPQEPVARGHVGRDAGVRPPPGDDDGTFPGEEERPFQVAQVAQTPGLVQVPDHEGKGFGHPAFALPQGFNGPVVPGVGGQVKASEAFDGHDPAVSQQAGGGGDGFPVQAPIPLFQPDPGAADGAGGGLGMKAPVLGIFIFRPALGAEVEHGHGGVGAVIGHRPDDGEPGAAVGAVGEGIPVAPVAGIIDVGQAVVAGGHVRGDQGRGGGQVPALPDGKAGAALGRGGATHHRIDTGQGRGLLRQLADKSGQRGWGAFDLDFDALGSVAHPAGQVVQPGQPVDKGPEADALHHAGHLQLFSGQSLWNRHAPRYLQAGNLPAVRLIAARPLKYIRFLGRENHPGRVMNQLPGPAVGLVLEPVPGLTRKTARSIENVV